ncbi:MAG: TIGR00266 family protein [Bacteroidetes bacterium]|nr:MAG: TIGR00266 family protein [Bacteroidota bacterium]RLD72099.1 MAG: TIGR00266 family protein [Bacteroidota bacterium]RLD95800.1 MAG: TIGR00266 family protein [Bacteroidota bacterium]
MRSHDLDYRIIGDDIQLVEIGLDPKETVIAEAGTMMYMDSQIGFDTKMGDGSDPNQSLMGKLLSAGTRVLTGESLFVTHFTNRGGSKQRVAFAAPYPGKIVPIELAHLGGSLIVQKDGFLCAAKGTKISITLNRRIGSGLVGGEGFIMQKLVGDGKAFMHAGGTVIERRMNNESLKIDTGCIVGYTPGIDFNIETSGNLRSMIFGGEGIFLASLSGTGTVWLQSMPIRKLIQAISPYGKNVRKESSSLLGNFLER